jgi:glutathione S-transferase
VSARLYTIELSHPGHAARLMLEHKGIDHEITSLPSGLQPVLLRALGFGGYTVPALKIDGRRIQGSLEIARELERIKPEPPLYPADPQARAKVEEAERWGEAEIQPVTRRIFRWALTQQVEAREWLARNSKPRAPFPRVQARTSAPLARRFASSSGATEERVRQDIAELPAKLDRADSLVSDGTLSAERPNAATFQIGTAVRALSLLPQIAPHVEARPCGRLARELLPDFPQAPVRLPGELHVP